MLLGVKTTRLLFRIVHEDSISVNVQEYFVLQAMDVDTDVSVDIEGIHSPPLVINDNGGAQADSSANMNHTEYVNI